MVGIHSSSQSLYAFMPIWTHIDTHIHTQFTIHDFKEYFVCFWKKTPNPKNMLIICLLLWNSNCFYLTQYYRHLSCKYIYRSTYARLTYLFFNYVGLIDSIIISFAILLSTKEYLCYIPHFAITYNIWIFFYFQQ